MSKAIRTYTIESLIAQVAKLTGEKFIVVGSGSAMGLQLEDEGGNKPTFSARGYDECCRYLQGMIRAANILKSKA
jgi:hypothetical protein